MDYDRIIIDEVIVPYKDGGALITTYIKTMDGQVLHTSAHITDQNPINILHNIEVPKGYVERHYGSKNSSNSKSQGESS